MVDIPVGTGFSLGFDWKTTNWFVVPVSKRAEWKEWEAREDDNARPPPSFLLPVRSYGLVIFPSFVVRGDEPDSEHLPLSSSVERIHNFAVVAYKDTLQELLDDPYGFSGSGAESLPDIVNEYRTLGGDLGLDFDQLIRELGSDFEVKRLLGHFRRDKAAADPSSS